MNKNKVRPDYNLGNINRSVFGHRFNNLRNFIERSFDIKNSEIIKKEKFVIAINKSKPISWITIARLDNETNCPLMVTSYPFIKFFNPVELKITSIEEWERSDGTEAIITGFMTKVPFPISFLDQRYVFNSSKYQVGKKYTFHFASVAMQLNKRTKLKVKDVDLATNKKNVLDSSEMTMFVNRKDYSEEFYFRVPVLREVKADIKFQDNNFYVLNYFLNAETAGKHYFEMPLFVNTIVSNGYIPKPGDAVEGKAWLFGYMADD